MVLAARLVPLLTPFVQWFHKVPAAEHVILHGCVKVTSSGLSTIFPYIDQMLIFDFDLLDHL